MLSKTWLLTRKELVLESRGRDTLPPMAAFAVTVVVLLAFALPGSARLTAPVTLPSGTVPLADVISGFLWVTLLFAGLIGFARTFEAERASGALESLLLVPIDRGGIYAAKALANLVFIVAAEVLIVPLFIILFGIDVGGSWVALILVIILVDIGFVAAGTLFAALAAATRSRELMLPLLALPALVPVFIAAVELSSDLFVGATVSDVAGRGWFGILVAYDIVFTVAGALAFEYALD
ncbi:MAG TPA: heme exporter protein CcmB [Actinomycetota bacterium]|nr:heme exporter protein CcmB [Actinomycetota bacterium]